MSFHLTPGTDGIYAVRDGQRSIGRVAKVYRGYGHGFVWVAVPIGDSLSVRGSRYAFRTRARAADALACYVDTGNREHIAPVIA